MIYFLLFFIKIMIKGIKNENFVSNENNEKNKKKIV